jgi:AcrR family transcriptional regulator
VPEPSVTLTPKGEATRQRIMAAASSEFAEHGIAGARVDRIAAEASTNKAQLYTYFGSKDELFDAVFMASMQRIVDVVPISPDDLADWAVRLYDDYIESPDLIRLATWHRLERRPTGHLLGEGRMDKEKLAGIASAQKSGAIAGAAAKADPFDVMAIVISMSMAWSPVSNVYAATADEAARVHRRRRDLLRETVRRAFAPDS